MTRADSRRLPGVVLFVFLLFFVGPLAAQSAGELPTPDELEARLQDWRAEIAASEARGQGSASEQALLALEWLEKQLERARRAEQLEAEAAEASRQLEAGPSKSLETPPPYSFDVLDSLLERREAEARAERSAQEGIDAAVRELEEAERGHRTAVREDRGEWTERAAQARLDLARQRLANVRHEQTAARCRHDLAQQVASYVGDHVLATAGELEGVLARLEEQRLQVEARRQDFKEKSELAEGLWTQAQGAVEETSSAAVRAEAAARRAVVDLEDARLRLLDEKLERLRLEGEIWRHRFAVALAEDVIEPPQLELDAIEAKLDLIVKERELGVTSFRAARRALGLSVETSKGAAPEPNGQGATAQETTVWIERHRQTLVDGIDAFEEDFEEIERLQTLLQRVQVECTPRGLRLSEGLSTVWRSMVRAWHFEILVVESRPITFGKALLALLLLLIGYRVSKRLSRVVGDVLRRRLHIASGVAAALQNLVLYLLLLVFFLWAFQLVGIPLTVFTVLGGVVAIGVGFGSQNIVNNFISGLILLIEQPIKVGDLIEVGGVLGSVERIGLRSTRVRAGDNTHVIVPNSSFLEKNVLNWTISDDVIRADLNIGVAYGSSTEEVRELIEQALKNEPLVLDSPGTEVLFLDFGDNALHFRAYFWIRVSAYLDRLRAASAVRFRIDKLFSEAGIVISYPQRDVHVDTITPLEIRMVEREPGTGPRRD